MHSPLRMLIALVVFAVNLSAQVTPAAKASPGIVDSDAFLKAHMKPARTAKPLTEVDKLLAAHSAEELFELLNAVNED